MHNCAWYVHAQHVHVHVHVPCAWACACAWACLRMVGAVVELGEGELLAAAAAAEESREAPHLVRARVEGLGLG